jgi:uncharacterized repeat protein (TIGR01451 family)
MAWHTQTWNGVAHASTYVSATEIQFTLTASDLTAVGTAQVVVVNPAPGGGAAPPSAIAIGYPMPVISALSPPAVGAGGLGLTLTVSGSGFSPSSKVLYDGIARATTYVSASALTIALSASDIATPGTAQITVMNGAPGGGTSAPATLAISQYPIPAITSLNPNSITVNSPDTAVGIQGSGFTAFSTVQINGSVVTPNYVDPGDLFVVVPAANFTAVGTVSITVNNPGTATSNAATLNVNPNLVPVLSGLSPSAAAIGSADFTLTVGGSNFASTSVVQWNGSARPTVFVNSNQLTATISARDIQSLGNYNVTVFTPAPGGGLSAASLFTTYLALPANDLVYSASTKLLYASVPSSGGPALGNSIVPIDPYTGAVGAPIFAGSEPGKMALSSDGSTIWVALNGAAAVREVNLNTHTAGLQFSLGGGTGIYDSPKTAQALAVLPGHPDTVAIAIPTSFTYSSVVTIYDAGVARANAQNANLPCCSGILGMVFDATGTRLYEAGSGYGFATVDNTGITSTTSLNASVSSNDLRVDNGRAYLTSGIILDANTGNQLGVFSVGPSQNANGPVAPDSTIGEGFVLTNPNFGSNFQISAYDLSSFVLNGSIPVAGVNSFLASPTSLTRWGQDGLAFTSGSQIYVLRSPLVRDLSTSLADLNVAANAPASGTTGTNLSYSFTIKNAGPVSATPATFIDNIPDGSTFVSVTSSQGNCSGTAVVTCDLGNLNSGNSATVHITVTPLTPGTLTNTVSVSAPQGDPNPADNTVVSTTTVTGSAYNATPALLSISPAFVQAGSSSFTMTVTGSGFSSNSTIQLNSTALSTTFVSSTQLTTSVDASNVASLGWAWISVTSSAPGGGMSARLPLTTYQVIGLDANRMAFDPFTRKLYASVPSTATQVVGNSLIAIDPSSASLGTPLGVGSEPNRLAESSDGRYLYIGLDGSKSVTRIDLTSMTQGPVYPLSIPSFGQPTQIAARDLAVAPGNDNLLAIDTGSFSGNGLFDISGSTGTMRPNLTGPYTGSNLVFANGTTLYSYDSDTTGAEFNRWSVTSTGLTLNDNTGYTLNGIGGFAGSYELVGGLIYGFAGGVADPSTTPPKQVGQFNVNAAQGAGQSIEGTGVAADPALGRVFILGETLAGSANPVLLSYDNNQYVLLNMQQFTGSIQGQDLIRWGRDGLAWHTSSNGAFGNSTPGSGQLFLMRGPFVLPEWGTVNPAPGLASALPSNATAGSGNLILTVTGSNFVPGAAVLWNGAERTTTFVDATHLTVAIPASDLSHAGTATLVVNNPGSSNSGSIAFSIN